MVRIFSLAVLAFTLLSYAPVKPMHKVQVESGKSVFPFRITKSEVDPNLYIKQSRVKLSFHFDNEPPTEQLVYMSINGLLENVPYTTGKTVTYDLTPGKYVFKIWGGPGYEEVISDSIEFKPQVSYEATVDMRIASEPVMVFKPVIYFHTDKPRDFSLNVQPKGDFTFTYPAIENGWNGKINTDGSLTVNGKKYPYLFWEAQQQYSFEPSGNAYHLKKDDYVAFLEKKCEELGFTAAERTDFITFWGMKMQSHEELFVQFLFNDQCNQFADLNFKEQPDAVQRVYICISDWDNSFQTYLNDVKFEAMPKGDFTVLEWGGYEFQLAQNSFLTNK